MNFYKLTPFVALCLVGSAPGQHPLQIDWGSSAITDRIVTSDGSAINTSEFSIELGGFANGFVATVSNVDQWLSNWQVFDAVTAPDSDNRDIFVTNGADSRFAGEDFLAADGTAVSDDGTAGEVFTPGTQAYVFIRNSDTLTQGSEWLLYTNQNGEDWEFPPVNGGQAPEQLTFFATEADEVLFGSANGIVGAGDFSDTSTDFLLRTHTVPEPSVPLFVLLASAGVFTRRRRA